MTEIDYAFWFSLLISSIYSAHDKTGQAAAWMLCALATLLISCFAG